MKIGFIGNCNNYPFIIAKQLKDIGHDILFIVTDPPNLHLNRPEHYDSSISEYPEWIKEIDLKSINYYFRLYLPRKGYKRYIRLLNECDAVILNGWAHELGGLLDKRVLTYSIFSGSDLDLNADYTFQEHGHKISNKYLKRLQFIKDYFLIKKRKRYRQGIKRSVAYSYFPEGVNPIGDQIIKDIKSNSNCRFPRWNSIEKKAPYFEPIEAETLKVLSACRFLWKEPLPSMYNRHENKRNDIMIHGIANFLKLYPNAKIEFHFFEKGLHINESKELISKLGFNDYVKWHNQVSQSKLLSFYKSSHIIIDQLGEHLMGGPGLDSMLIGRPVIANYRPEIIDRITLEKAPICQARTDKEVTTWLSLLYKDENLRKQIGKDSREFILKHDGNKEEAQFILNTFEHHFNSEN